VDGAAFRFLPTRKNRYMRKLDSEIRTSLRQLIQRKKQAWSLGRSSSYGGDLISVMTVGNKDQQQQQQGVVLQKGIMSIEEIVEECKTFFFAGHDTTLCLLAWTMILLGMHPQWQDRARKEIISICRHQPPKPENVSQLKIVRASTHQSILACLFLFLSLCAFL
jgi:cytochrome P450